MVRAGRRRIRPLHVQELPEGEAIRHLRLPRMRRSGGARAAGEDLEGTRVRRLEEKDIDDAIALTDLENWGYTRADFHRLLALSPSGCFVAERAGQVVGCLTTTSHDGPTFLGAVIVRPDLRGKGVGQTMMEATLQYLASAGVRTVRLYAYLRAIPFYERLGFHREYEVVRWNGPAEVGRIRGVRPLRRDDLPAVAGMDAPYFGANRLRLLDRLSEEFASTFLVAESRGRIRGFVVGNPSGDSCEVGPWVVEPRNERVAVDLLRSLIAAAGVSEIAFSGPTTNEALLAFVHAHRLREVFRALRMWWGSNEFAGDPRAIWAVAGLEKG
jgi:N-acetylglutamate synthase-like GNAT family acetyltransferase